jgi:hypothetical protein
MSRSGWLVACCRLSLPLALAACGGGSTNPPDTPEPPSLVSSTGNDQTGQVSTALAQPITVLVRNASGNPLQGVAISWATASGGSMAAATTQSGANGIATVAWTLGGNAGQQTATASLSGATGSPVSFTATATAAPAGAVTITGVDPSPMVEGQQATIVGTGFGTSTAGLAVTVDGATATVTLVTATAVTVMLPASTSCKPARDGEVRVTRSGTQSNGFSAPLVPAAFLSLDVGKQVVLQDPSAFCLQFPADAGSQDYLIGVQSTSEVVSNLTPITLTATASGAVPPLPAPSLRAGLISSPSANLSSSPSQQDRAQRWDRHRAAEGKLRRSERQMRSLAKVTRRAAGRAGLSTMSIPGPLQVGDLVSASVPDVVNGSLCTPVPVTAVVRTIGSRGIWLEDVDNPAGGYTSADFDDLSAQLDNLIYDADVSHFGAPTDLDGTGRIYVLITKETNKTGGALGFVAASDLFSQASCPSSNEGEIFYGAAPDPTGVYANGAYSLATAKADAPFLIAHEFSHIIQFSRRLYVAQAPFMASWTAEGQATMAEEVVGFAAEGHAAGQNLGFDVAFNMDDPSSIDWYSWRFGDLAFYYGFQGAPAKVPGAPGECSWLDKPPANPGPCLGGRDVYGVPWSLLQWMSDQYGPSFPGGEAGLQQALINSSEVGYQNLASVVGVPIKTLLARWAASLYVDDRVPGADPSLTIPTWNLVDIFDGHLNQTARLTPTPQGFGSFTEAANVRAGSTAYYRVSGTNRPATSVRVRGATGGTLPATMQVFVVRLQ